MKVAEIMSVPVERESRVLHASARSAGGLRLPSSCRRHVPAQRCRVPGGMTAARAGLETQAVTAAE
jgi:hypothetical protein